MGNEDDKKGRKKSGKKRKEGEVESRRERKQSVVRMEGRKE